jgi:uncharacterized integral membrane protein
LISIGELIGMELKAHPESAQEKSRTWWQRNWKWFVPVAAIGFLALFAAFIVFIITIVFGMVKSSDVYKKALATTQAHPAVVKALGSPIEGGIFVMGSINTSGPSGQADLAIPISGPIGKGTIYARASKAAGRWTFSQLVVEIKATKERIDLIESQEHEKTSLRYREGSI